jgi:nucleotide sugar dehydrogenase
MLKIGIIGKGILGTSIYNFFNSKVIVYDKYKKIGLFTDILKSDILFLCLPTLFNEETKTYNTDEIHSICKLLSDNNFNKIIILKSTVVPKTTDNLNKMYDLNIIHNPEFLSETTASEDFKNQNHIVLGSENNDYLKQCVDFYKLYFQDADISIMSSTESELMKIAVNNFYSSKLIFFNELYLLCQEIDISYDKVKDSMLKNGWINPMHTTVPGKNNKLGFGGMCFPKDTNAYLNFLKEHSKFFKITEATVLENNEIIKL